jgi:hypothetical protein
MDADGVAAQPDETENTITITRVTRRWRRRTKHKMPSPFVVMFPATF